MQMTRSYNEIADRIAPSSTVRRHRADAATQHALRMQEVSMEVEVVRAEPKHLTLLVQLFDQYRVFYQQHSDPERAMQFLLERLEKNQSAIFIALPILSQDTTDDTARERAATEQVLTDTLNSHGVLFLCLLHLSSLHSSLRRCRRSCWQPASACRRRCPLRLC